MRLLIVEGVRAEGSRMERVPVVAVELPVERLPERVQHTLRVRSSWPDSGQLVLEALYPYEPDPNDYVITKKGDVVTVGLQPAWWLRVVLGREPLPEWLELLPSPNDEERQVLQDLLLAEGS